MTMERLPGFALMKIHYEKHINYDAVAQVFAKTYPRGMLFVDLVFDEMYKIERNAVHYYIFRII